MPRLGVVLGKDSRCLVDGGALFGARRREHSRLGLVTHALDFPQQSLSAGGDREDLAAAVALIALALNQLTERPSRYFIDTGA
jgi:hypothetical protein